MEIAICKKCNCQGFLDSSKTRKKKSIMEILLYKSENDVQVEVSIDKETVWLSQRQMGTLFNKHTNIIRLHLKNIYQVEEMQEKATVRNLRTVQKYIGWQKKNKN